MHNKDSAHELNMNITGNARAYRYSDEPLIRMRNTAIKPGQDKLAMVRQILQVNLCLVLLWVMKLKMEK